MTKMLCSTLTKVRVEHQQRWGLVPPTNRQDGDWKHRYFPPFHLGRAPAGPLYRDNFSIKDPPPKQKKSDPKGMFFLPLQFGRLTWNIIMEAWKIIFLSKWVICRFHVNLPGCKKCRFWTIFYLYQHFFTFCFVSIRDIFCPAPPKSSHAWNLLQGFPPNTALAEAAPEANQAPGSLGSFNSLKRAREALQGRESHGWLGISRLVGNLMVGWLVGWLVLFGGWT